VVHVKLRVVCSFTSPHTNRIHFCKVCRPRAYRTPVTERLDHPSHGRVKEYAA
jgi:hypothetical protein